MSQPHKLQAFIVCARDDDNRPCYESLVDLYPRRQLRCCRLMPSPEDRAIRLISRSVSSVRILKAHRLSWIMVKVGAFVFRLKSYAFGPKIASCTSNDAVRQSLSSLSIICEPEDPISYRNARPTSRCHTTFSSHKAET